MNSKELVRNMIAFLNERHDMDAVQDMMSYLNL